MPLNGNPWLPRVETLGNRLEHYGHTRKQQAYNYAAHKTAQAFGERGAAVGSAIGFAASEGARRFGSWYYPSASTYVRNRPALARKTFTLTQTKRKRRYKKKTCCRYIKGKKVCEPRFCREKNKYWY